MYLLESDGDDQGIGYSFHSPSYEEVNILASRKFSELPCQPIVTSGDSKPRI